jgi:hypothetical protein
MNVGQRAGVGNQAMVNNPVWAIFCPGFFEN